VQNRNIGPRLKGLTGLSDIVQNFGKKQWEIISLHQIGGNWDVLLGLSNATKYYPLGRQQWYLLDNGENRSGGNYRPTFLQLSKVLFHR
jgi:hypothetical protein